MTTTTIRTDRFPSKSGHWSLYAGGIAAILASTCHHILFLLVMLGLSSTKIIYIVTLADWARPFLIIAAIVALFVSYQYIWHVFSDYKSRSAGITSQANIADKIFFVFIAMLIIVVLMLPHFAPCTE